MLASLTHVRGFTLPELLIAMLLSMLVLGAFALVVPPLQALVPAQLETADLHQRLRYGVRRITADLMNAADVLPFRAGVTGDDRMAGVFFRPDVITARNDRESHTYHLRTDASGVRQLMHYDGGLGDFPLVDHVLSLGFSYRGVPTTAICVPEAGDVAPLVAIEPSEFTDGPWCPSAASPARIDADVLRIRLVHVEVRMQVAHPSLRGARGPLFATGGTASRAERYVPDRAITFDVAPRGIAIPR